MKKKKNERNSCGKCNPTTINSIYCGWSLSLSFKTMMKMLSYQYADSQRSKRKYRALGLWKEHQQHRLLCWTIEQKEAYRNIKAASLLKTRHVTQVIWSRSNRVLSECKSSNKIKTKLGLLLDIFWINKTKCITFTQQNTDSYSK